METVTGVVVMVLPGQSGLTVALRTPSGPRVGLAVGAMAGELAGQMQAGETWTIEIGPNTVIRAARYGPAAQAPAQP